MKITDYISDLLHTHDCVVIPGFGGFVSNYAPAKIHPVNHTFYPPSKSILFNPKLISDDGLLLHAISIREGISYEQAKQMVEEFTHECRHDLNEGRSVKLERIGKIRKDDDGRYLFDPDTTLNYLEESFVLPAFISPPVVRTPMHKRLEKKFADRRPQPAGGLKNKKIHWASVALVPVLLLIGWLIISPELKFNASQQTGVISFSEPDFKNTGSIVSPPVSGPVSPLKEKNSSDQVAGADQNLITESPAVQDKEDTEILTPRYYVIGGAFKMRDNADKMLAAIRDEGYKAEDAGRNPAGLYMVSYFSSEDKSEALVNLATIRREKNPSAWLLKK